MRPRSAAFVNALVLVLLPGPAAAQDAPKSGPWRLADHLGLPEWLEVGVQQRTRYESLDEEFRAGRSGSNQLFALRTLVATTARYEDLRATVELMDSRQMDAPADARLGTDIVNAVELLQANVGYELDDPFSSGGSLDVRVGRQTLDVGSRRLVARNRFRNTINSFTGIDAVWTSTEEETLRAFFLLPVNRLPRDLASLRDNDIQLDEELDEVRFFGVHGAAEDLFGDVAGEAYLYGLDEDDSSDAATRNRELYTVGARLLKRPATGELDFEWESAFQLGDSRSSATSNVDLDHEAHFHHLSVGYRFDADMEPRLEALFDYASGDDDPTDGSNERFDTLFGARRFEYGPTGIFGAFARSNSISPGLRLGLKPAPRTQVMLAWRLHYLASDRDAWTTSGLADPTGSAGRSVGQLAEVRVRHDVAPGNLRLEAGFARFFAGDFVDDAPNATGQGDANYGYVAAILSF